MLDDDALARKGTVSIPNEYVTSTNQDLRFQLSESRLNNKECTQPMSVTVTERARTVSSDTSISSLRSETSSSSSPSKESAGASFPKTGKRGCPQQFPRKLYEMIERQTREGEGKEESSPLRPPCIQWSPSGRSFHITSMSLFTTSILPYYFKTSKFSSFQRNLNLYGFSKLIRGTDRGSYFHPMFGRGEGSSFEVVKRVKKQRKKKEITHANKTIGEGSSSPIINKFCSSDFMNDGSNKGSNEWYTNRPNNGAFSVTTSDSRDRSIASLALLAMVSST
ncbi:hypothetical protein TrLO_g707 [Triparma laevis f. longispina]|uniref:HSF-type DNA-binding domain-containing protein n=1 Tax=Triparma laevis f. longispina TaxID=1714387 RepID=A0A9W7ANK9_9STRA|nr:hypothetical protein TrLO_g707 [Triparma laevis f. longispina]